MAAIFGFVISQLVPNLQKKKKAWKTQLTRQYKES
jgi:hypothetical protein